MLQVKSIISGSSCDYNFDVSLSSSDPYTREVEEHKEEVLSDEGDILFYNKYKDGTYSFGLIQGARESFEHEKGYVWSSRASMINQFLGTNIIEVGIYYADEGITAISRAIDVDTLRGILPEGFDIIKGQYSDGEEYYKVVLKDGRKVQCDEILYKVGDADSNTPVYNLTTII